MYPHTSVPRVHQRYTCSAIHPCSMHQFFDYQHRSICAGYFGTVLRLLVRTLTYGYVDVGPCMLGVRSTNNEQGRFHREYGKVELGRISNPGSVPG